MKLCTHEYKEGIHIVFTILYLFLVEVSDLLGYGCPACGLSRENALRLMLL